VKFLLMLTAAGCGRIGFDAGDAPRGSGPFGPATAFAWNSAVGDDDPALSGDALEMIFDSERDGTPGDLYVTRRTDRSAAWSMPAVITELATASSDEDGPALSADGLTLTFSSNRPGGPAMDNMWITTRPDRASAWSPPVLIAELNTANVEDHFTMTADDLVGVLSATGTGSHDLYETRRSSATSVWGAPALISELNEANYDGGGDIDTTGTLLVFMSNRTGTSALDLLIATRASRDEPFDQPQGLAELNTAGDDADPSLSSDLRVIAFVRGTDATRDIYFAER
jgi:Tol biopolymer transport system component